ncbi:MAG TPA: EamA/RhaT family transporter [Bacteroidia bacterium]|nr:EamA/RhaT family transporter [Bacteroidia bacterium]HNT80261.1 EamA/RhaT family transporter [Bacteroidia bacterium]
MALYLLLSIVLATTLFIILKLYKTFRVNTGHAIVVNYFVASSIAFGANSDASIAALSSFFHLLPITLIIGLMFIVVFNITGFSSQSAGISVTSVAAKMSMVIPIFFGLFLYNDSLNFTRIIGIISALIAVYIINKPDKNNAQEKKDLWLPVLVFAGSGLVDSSIKYAQHFYMTNENRQLLIAMLFGSAGLLGVLHYAFNVIYKKDSILNLRSIIGGLILGIANYFSLHFLLLCFQYPGSESAMIFSIVNIGVVLLAAICGYLFLNETLNGGKLLGVLIAVFSIIILYSSK